MAKRRAKKSVKEVPTSAVCEIEGNDKKDGRTEENKVGLIDQEVERQCAAIRAVRDVEIEHMLTALRLLRSYFSEDQLQTPALRFFDENLPNLSVVRNSENAQFEVKLKHEDGNISLHSTDSRDIHASLILEGTSESRMFGMHDARRTLGVTSLRLSFGMTPKAMRLPKPGKMLLSVHGSPLVVYKEDNMEAINESEEW